MEKSATEVQFAALVSQVLWPHFKHRGFRKAGNNFRWLHPDGSGKIMQLQRSTSSSRHHIQFTLNAGLYLPEANRWHAPTTAFAESLCVVRQRIGTLKKAHDQWYALAPEVNVPSLYQAVEQDVVQYILPFLDQVSSRADILRLITSVPHLASDVNAIEVLQANGNLEAAAARLQQALANAKSPANRQYWRDLALELGL